jgi:hypothetical protein
LRLEVKAPFRYVGGQRFILQGVADAEQHLFVDTPPGETLRRLYWIQFEQYLPGRGGEYNYGKDAPLARWGLQWRTHVRRFADPPVAGSDRSRVYQLLEQHRLTLPNPSVRARLVYVPDTDRRQELMIIYLEAAGSADPTPVESAALIERALANLEITP